MPLLASRTHYVMWGYMISLLSTSAFPFLEVLHIQLGVLQLAVLTNLRLKQGAFHRIIRESGNQPQISVSVALYVQAINQLTQDTYLITSFLKNMNEI
ncbi:hypothetical protein DFH07DRAFT_808494 [Mycena maculata]|uniref:Uncharacterized protein n=1 Tax=Mycena maculata TaxID=230809 RepID=A0AAD7JP38_9AGAR|nr:hypothetical protein DFH07DRAFT_808494 [Mycena maculata]